MTDLGGRWPAIPEWCPPTRRSACHRVPAHSHAPPVRPTPKVPAVRLAVSDRGPPHQPNKIGVPSQADSASRATTGSAGGPPSGSSTGSTPPVEPRHCPTDVTGLSEIPPADHHRRHARTSIDARIGVTCRNWHRAILSLHLSPAAPAAPFPVEHRHHARPPPDRYVPPAAGAKARVETVGPNPRQCFT